MKNKQTAMKVLKASNYIVLGVSHCDLQATLTFETPQAYAARVEGWACDLYRINDKYSIVTGYDTGRSSTCHANDFKGLSDAIRALEQKVINDNMTRDQRKAALVALLDEYM